MQTISDVISEEVKEMFGVELDAELTRPDPQFGDLATNVALRVAKTAGQKPREVADKLARALRTKLSDTISEVTVAGPGFINLHWKDAELLKQLDNVLFLRQSLAKQVIVAEYGDPNPFKVLHAGHLYTAIVGDAIANLLEMAGATVHRVNYGGDVGLHVGRTMWAILKKLKGVKPENLEEIPEADRAGWLAERYVEGTNAYEDDEAAKQEIIELNKHVYRLHAQNDHDTAFAHIYWTCRQWSYDYFAEFYERIGVVFEKVYPESEVVELGVKTVQEHMKPGIFEKSDGAIVFKGEGHDLHTRVFINSQGLPTYEAKEVGLIFQKKADFNFDRSVVITGNEQAQYMQVVLKAIEQFAPELTKATSHLTHGLVKLKGGVKMSSRKGNILRAVDILEAATAANAQARGGEVADADNIVTLGAIKYAFLKTRIGGDMSYDPEESVSLEGNSGPYLQYAHARAKSILAKANDPELVAPTDLEADERSLASKLSQFPEVVEQSIAELMPHPICTYLYETSQAFNRFYENNRVIGDDRQDQRLYLVNLYAGVLKAGLGLLGITAPDKM